VPKGVELEYKFTLGSWDREALGPSGTVMPNFKLTVNESQAVKHTLDRWKKDPREYMADWAGSGVQGSLVYWQDVESAFLDLSRHIVIWLPPGYDAERESGYPVLYMHDGQNLFDPRMGGSAGNVWDVDDAIVRLVDRGVMPPVIVVGAFNTADRMWEYSPWHRAPDYARFLIEELMPRVNAEFNTLTGPEHTSVMGSSMGGLASYYLVTNHPDVFGACGCVSSAFQLNEEGLSRFTGMEPKGAVSDTPFIVRDIEAGLRFPEGVRYWFDYGTEGLDATYRASHDALRAAFLAQGWQEGADFAIRVYPGADHNEASWRDRLEDPLMFLFGD
jgi:enterochelin esterase-like enzyme